MIVPFQLTEHFSISEATTSATATREGIKNIPSWDQLMALLHSAVQMERVREFLGAPVLVTSWFRCPELNAAVGGVANSSHLSGHGVDFQAPGAGDLAMLFSRLANGPIDYDQLILEAGHLHISFAPAMRHEAFAQ